MKKAVSILLVAVMLVSLLAISSFAAPADFTLQGKTVELADEDVTIEVPIITSHGDFYYGLECTWEADAPLELVGFTPNDKETNGYAGLISVSVADQKVVWMDTAFIGTEIESGAAVWTATYKVPKDTAAGTYNVKVNIAQITSLENDMESDIELNATITVKGGELPPAPTPEYHEAKPATCTEAGNIEYWTLEGKFYSDAECTIEINEADTVIPATGHTLVKTEEVPADCTNAGTEAYYTCSVCNKMFSDAEGKNEITAPIEIPAKGHTPGTPVRENEVPATTEAAGSYDEVVYCTVCGAEISRETKTIPQLDHVHTMEKVEAKAATCTEDGNIEYYKCSSCGKLFSDEAGTKEITLESTVIPAAHTPGEAVTENEVPATCTEAGSYDEVVYCTVCGAEISRETKTIEALGHDWGEWVDNGDETKTHTCSRCGETETVPTGLSKVEAKPATCTEAGSIEYYVDTETGKLYADIEGTTEIAEADTVIPALGHDWGVWREQADGSMVRTCSRCGEIETLTAGPVEPPVTPVTPVIPSRPTTYTLSFETNGGSAIEAVTANANQEVFLASFVPTCEGKTFYGWFTEAELTNKVDKIALSKDTTVYAFWLPFSDIPADAWYIDEVAQLKPLGLLDGFDTAEFKGDEQTTRGMIVTTLYALAGAPEVTGEMAFNDVAEDNFSYKAVIWATENGIAKGYGDGTFKPDQSVSRQELVCFLYRYAAFKGLDVTGRADLSAYTDAAQVASWAAEEMAWAVNAGLVKGMSDTVLQPAGTGTHAQWAALLVRVAEFGK